jgi:hypothetical protein
MVRPVRRPVPSCAGGFQCLGAVARAGARSILRATLLVVDSFVLRTSGVRIVSWRVASTPMVERGTLAVS